MAVPIFETKTDRYHQTAAAFRVRRHFDCELIQTEESLHLAWDYEFYRDRELVGLGGYKRRHYWRNSFNTYAVSHQDYRKLCAAAAEHGVPCAVFVEWNGDDIGFVDTRRVNEDDVRPGGRSPRPGSIRDLEPMLHIPIRRFKVVP